MAKKSLTQIICCSPFYADYASFDLGTIGLWRGSENLEMGTSDLYSFHLNGSIHHQLGDISVSNGMAWNSDNSVMFYTDTRTRRIDAFDYDIEIGKIGMCHN